MRIGIRRACFLGFERVGFFLRSQTIELLKPFREVFSSGLDLVAILIVKSEGLALRLGANGWRDGARIFAIPLGACLGLFGLFGWFGHSLNLFHLLGAFLGNVRAAVTVATVLPLAALATFLLMRMAGMSARSPVRSQRSTRAPRT